MPTADLCMNVHQEWVRSCPSNWLMMLVWYSWCSMACCCTGTCEKFNTMWSVPLVFFPVGHRSSTSSINQWLTSLISFQSSLSTIVKSGRLNGVDALLINCTLSNLTLVTAASHSFLVEMLLYWKDFALVTHALLINIISLAIANHSATNVNVL